MTEIVYKTLLHNAVSCLFLRCCCLYNIQLTTNFLLLWFGRRWFHPDFQRWFGGFSGGRVVCGPLGGWGPTEILLVEPSIYQTCNIDVRWYNAPPPSPPLAFPAFPSFPFFPQWKSFKICF